MPPLTGNPPIVLTTDFGTSDAFVGVMKGVILTINPDATIIDLTHEIGPQNLRQGAFVLGVNHSYFPPGAIHVAVVDPGVGTTRKPIVLETPAAKFVGPDNGLFSEVIKAYLPGDAPPANDGAQVVLPHPLKAWELAAPRFRLHPVSNTFHGRDVFAPAAAHLSLGVGPEELGPAVSELTYLPLNKPSSVEAAVIGEVIYTDRFGNLGTNISAIGLGEWGTDGASALVEIGPRRIVGLSRTFHDNLDGRAGQPDGLPLVALIGSNGYLEIAVRDGNAAETLGFGVGETVRISFGS